VHVAAGVGGDGLADQDGVHERSSVGIKGFYSGSATRGHDACPCADRSVRPQA
jgi:hypothetical protein